MGGNSRARLSTMMALIYAVQGAWWPMLALHLGDLGLTGRERGWMFAAYPLAAALMSLGAGSLVDRRMAAQKYLAICYAVGAVILGALGLGLRAGSPGLFGLFLAYWLIIAPTYGIAGAIAFRNLARPEAEFGRVRLWGTVGWMVAGWLVSAAMAASGTSATGDGAYEAFWVAAAASGLLAAFALRLPDTPPLAVGGREGRWGAAGELVRVRPVAVLLVTAFGVSLTTPMVYQAMPTYYEALGLPRRWASTAATLGQVPEVLALAVLPGLLRRLGVKATLLIGMAAWLARFAMLACRPPLWLAVAGIPLHGVGIACFTVGAQVFLDARAPGDRRAGAQALYSVATTGLGALAGSLMAGELLAISGGDASGVFNVPCLILFGLIGFFIRAFRPDAPTTARPAVASPPERRRARRRVRPSPGWATSRWSRPMGDYLRLLTVSDRDIPLVDLQRAAQGGAVWSVDHPGMLGNYLAIGPKVQETQAVWATVERNPVGPNTLGAEEVAEFIDSLESGGPPSAVRWLSDFLESVRAIYAIRIYPDTMVNDPHALDAVYAVRTALRQAVGGIGQWDGLGFTNEDDRLIWTDASLRPSGKSAAAVLDESSGRWTHIELDLDDPEALEHFLRGEVSHRRH